MSYFKWNDNLDIGVDAMNDEHKMLIDMMNKLYERSEAKAPKAELVEIAKQLNAYTTKHFQDEEGFLTSINYDGLNLHRKIHKDLLTKLANHIASFETGPATQVSFEFFNFLKLWLSAHIMGIDMKYGDFVRGLGAKRTA